MLELREKGNQYLTILKELACYITGLTASGFNKAVDDCIVCIGEKQIFFLVLRQRKRGIIVAKPV